MRISPPRKEIRKQHIRDLIKANPKIDNQKLAQKVGLHRNTVTRYLDEIQLENEKIQREYLANTTNQILEGSRMRMVQLEEIWMNYFSSSKASQLVSIVEAYWRIQKDVYRIRLETLGIRKTPQTMVQVNVSK